MLGTVLVVLVLLLFVVALACAVYNMVSNKAAGRGIPPTDPDG